MANKKGTTMANKTKTPTEAKITEFYEHRSTIVMKAIVAKGLRCNKKNSNGVVKGFNL